MATAPQSAGYYCSDPNCVYCKDLRLGHQQLSGERDLIAETQTIKPQSDQRMAIHWRGALHIHLHNTLIDPSVTPGGAKII